MLLLPFLEPSICDGKQPLTSEEKVKPCFTLGSGTNHSSGYRDTLHPYLLQRIHTGRTVEQPEGLVGLAVACGMEYDKYVQ